MHLFDPVFYIAQPGALLLLPQTNADNRRAFISADVQ
jgi:hypothetical protein